MLNVLLQSYNYRYSVTSLRLTLLSKAETLMRYEIIMM